MRLVHFLSKKKMRKFSVRFRDKFDQCQGDDLHSNFRAPGLDDL